MRPRYEGATPGRPVPAGQQGSCRRVSRARAVYCENTLSSNVTALWFNYCQPDVCTKQKGCFNKEGAGKPTARTQLHPTDQVEQNDTKRLRMNLSEAHPATPATSASAFLLDLLT
jgi:hypothetical protein